MVVPFHEGNHWVFDLGAHLGEDTDFYLKKGFNVLAVEAYPPHLKELRGRFSKEISNGRLKTEPFCIGSSKGEATLYVHDSQSDWNSLTPDFNRRGRFEPITVPVDTFANIIGRNPKPYYIKADIEGAEKYVMNALDIENRPKYFSFEINDSWTSIISHALGIGYREAQIVDQSRNNQTRAPYPAREGFYVDQVFSGHHSGLFGAELDDCSWQAIGTVDTFKQRVAALSWGKGEWYDIHLR